MSTLATPRPPRRMAAWRHPTMALLCSLLLAACGPGVGGSGTGGTESALPVFGASTAALCSSDLAPLLGCAATVGGALPGAIVYFVDTIDGGRVQASVQGNDIVLDVPCSGLRFRGTWGQAPGQAARFYGFLGADESVPAALGVLRDGSTLQLTLRDGSGAVLLGPVLLRPSATAGVPGRCG